MLVKRAVAIVAALVGVSLGAAAAARQTVVSSYLVAGAGQVRSSADPGATVGDADATVHAAAGVEGRVANGRLGVGAEIGYLAKTGHVSGGQGVLSPNATLYFKRGSPLVPFAITGYSLLFRFGYRTFDAFNVGAGIEYWMTCGVGLRLEVRDHIQSGSRARNHYWVARAGLAFR